MTATVELDTDARRPIDRLAHEATSPDVDTAAAAAAVRRHLEEGT
jgi:hypothetical protein